MTSKKREVTGRDAHIILTALSYAIGAIQTLPNDKQEVSECDDMIMLLHTLEPSIVSRLELANNVLHHAGVRPELEVRRLGMRQSEID